MSDPVTNVEIEDVLSSIRRLVSEDSRPKFDRQALEKHDENSENPPVAATEALVLTPALRVAEFPEPVEIAEDTQQEMAETQAESYDNVGDLDDSIADEYDDTSAGHSEEWAEDESHDDSTGTGDSVEISESNDTQADQNGHEEAGQVERTLEVVRFDGGDTADAESGESEGPYDHLSLETRIAEVEDAVADQDDQWEPDGDDEGDNAAEPVETLQWEDHVDPSSASVNDETAEGQNQEYWHDDRVEDEQDEIEIEDALPQSTDTEDEFSDDISATESFTADVADDEVPNADVMEGNENHEPDVDLFGADDAILDEDALREMVSEIVRQELQGALGERITRNVRKLVRREIHRALASQELD